MEKACRVTQDSIDSPSSGCGWTGHIISRHHHWDRSCSPTGRMSGRCLLRTFFPVGLGNRLIAAMKGEHRIGTSQSHQTNGNSLVAQTKKQRSRILHPNVSLENRCGRMGQDGFNTFVPSSFQSVAVGVEVWCSLALGPATTVGCGLEILDCYLF